MEGPEVEALCELALLNVAGEACIASPCLLMLKGGLLVAIEKLCLLPVSSWI